MDSANSRSSFFKDYIVSYLEKKPKSGKDIGLQMPDAVHGQTGEQKKMWKNKIYRRNEQGLQANP